MSERKLERQNYRKSETIEDRERKHADKSKKTNMKKHIALHRRSKQRRKVD